MRYIFCTVDKCTDKIHKSFVMIVIYEATFEKNEIGVKSKTSIVNLYTL